MIYQVFVIHFYDSPSRLLNVPEVLVVLYKIFKGLVVPFELVHICSKGERRISLRHNILTHNILTDDILTYNIILGDILQEERNKDIFLYKKYFSVFMYLWLKIEISRSHPLLVQAFIICISGLNQTLFPNFSSTYSVIILCECVIANEWREKLKKQFSAQSDWLSRNNFCRISNISTRLFCYATYIRKPPCLGLLRF